MVSYKDIMMGFLEMERAGNRLDHLFVGPRLLDTCTGKPRGDRMPDTNFLNAILFEIIDSNGQPNRQYSVLYAITVVFIAILITITGKQRAHMVTITLTRHAGHLQRHHVWLGLW